MAGPDVPKSPEVILDAQLSDIHSAGILLSDKAEQQIKDGQRDIYTLQDMAHDIRELDKMDHGEKGSGIKIREADVNLVEEKLRRIDDISEIEIKGKQLGGMFWKYYEIRLAETHDILRFFGQKVPPDRKIYRQTDLDKVHSLPLDTVHDWTQVHFKRVDNLEDLMKAGIVKPRDYKKYRDMEPQTAIDEMVKIKKASEKKDRQEDRKSADALLQSL